MYVKLLRSCWDDFAICAGVLAGALLLSLLPSILFSSPPLMISGLILPIVSAFLILIFSLSYFGFQFSHLVRFGSTRRRSLALTFGLAATVALFCMLLSALLTGVEGLLVSIRRDVPPQHRDLLPAPVGLVCHPLGRHSYGSAVRHHSPPLRQEGHVGPVGDLDVGLLHPPDFQFLSGPPARPDSAGHRKRSRPVSGLLLVHLVSAPGPGTRITTLPLPA